MLRPLRALVLVVILAGCGDDGEGRAARTCDPALNGIVRDPAATLHTSFRIAADSSVKLPDGSRESLAGAFAVSDCLSPNTFYGGRIETLTAKSQSLVIESGCAAAGTIVSSTLYGGDTPTSFSISARINGEVVLLTGKDRRSMRAYTK